LNESRIRNVSDPVVSILTPAYRAEAFLEETVRSVIAQTFPDWELIIVNDGSPDGTGALADRLAKEEPRIRVFHRKTSSGRPAIPRNLALDHARGRYLALLDADDLWHPEKLERQLAFMERYGASFSCTAYGRITETGIRRSVVHVPLRANRNRLLMNNTVGCLTVMIDRERFPDLTFDERGSLRGREDYGLWLKLLESERYVYGLDEVLADYRVVNGSVSRNKWDMAKGQWRVYRQSAKLPVWKASLCMMSWAFFGYLRNRR
jgi:teichuronic acid biosynthesis glycosyltransferase TuaG